MTEPDTLPHLEVLLRLLVAFACGGAIGLNREFHRKPAGFRTFGLLSIGCALVVIVMYQAPQTGADAVSRVMQGVLTGVGFLGAGVILHRMAPAKVAGLTTAASVWLAAGLGLAAGAGQYFVVATATVLGLLILWLGKHIEKQFFGKKKKSDRLSEDEPPT